MRIALLGVGMVGGSLLAAWRRAGLVETATGYDIETGAVADADVVLVATPVGSMRKLFARLAPALPAGALLTDVGSTKGGVIADARAVLGAAFPRFVPAHPIAGKELPGVEHADAGLFVGKRVVLTPVAETSREAVAKVEGLFARSGARVEQMDAAEHDRIFAAVSHLPHLLSFALVASIGAAPGGERKLGYGGAGFRDFTRIAASSPAMWRDICVANREAIGEELRGYRALLERMQRAVDEGDAAALQQTFELAARLRRQWANPADAR
jgi:prephenate dehydrogenase